MGNPRDHLKIHRKTTPGGGENARVRIGKGPEIFWGKSGEWCGDQALSLLDVVVLPKGPCRYTPASGPIHRRGGDVVMGSERYERNCGSGCGEG